MQISRRMQLVRSRRWYGPWRRLTSRPSAGLPASSSSVFQPARLLRPRLSLAWPPPLAPLRLRCLRLRLSSGFDLRRSRRIHPTTASGSRPKRPDSPPRGRSNRASSERRALATAPAPRGRRPTRLNPETATIGAPPGQARRAGKNGSERRTSNPIASRAGTRLHSSVGIMRCFAAAHDTDRGASANQFGLRAVGAEDRPTHPIRKPYSTRFRG